MGRKSFMWMIGLFAVMVSCLSLFVTACNKTDSPLGVHAPMGFDYPTLTPTPQTGAIEVYVKDAAIVSSGAVQGVSIALINPSGVTFGVNTTQPIVGYAAFNPSNLVNGIWNAVVPAQAVSYQLVSSGVTTTVRRTYGNSTLPITISGGGQYSATFSTGGNAVALSPLTQNWTTTNPQFIPVTAVYSETGNLDVPVTVTMNGLPVTTLFQYLNPNTWAFGGTNPYYAAVTISRTACYYLPVTLSLTASDLSGNAIPTAGEVISKSASIPVTAMICKHANGGGIEVFEFEFFEPSGSATFYCNNNVYQVTYQIGSCVSPSGTIHVNTFPGNTISQSVTYSGGADPCVNATFQAPNGQQYNTYIQAQYLSFDSFTGLGNTTW